MSDKSFMDDYLAQLIELFYRQPFVLLDKIKNPVHTLLQSEVQGKKISNDFIDDLNDKIELAAVFQTILPVQLLRWFRKLWRKSQPGMKVRWLI